MSSSVGFHRSFSVGVVGSVTVHAVLGVLLARSGPGTIRVLLQTESDRVVPLTPIPPEPTPDEPERRVRPGIDHSTAVTDTWLGFTEPTEHSAPLSSVEQADLAMSPGASEGLPEDPPEPDPSNQAADPRESASAQSAESPASPSTAAGSDSAPISAPRNPSPSTPPPAPAPSLEPPRANGDRPAQESASKEHSAPAPPIEPAPPTIPPPLPATSSPSVNTSDAPLRTAPAPRRKVGDQPGQIADRESVAAALKEALDIKPGKPLAAGGLDIKTSIARWSVTTRLTVVPRNPVVRVVFGREGNVIKADFIKGYDTGAASVDEPLLDAIYRWKASGEPLKTLPTGDPNAGVSLIFRILLREPG